MLLAIASVLGGWRTVTGVSAYLDGPKTVDAARDIGNDSLADHRRHHQPGRSARACGGLFLVALNAMRVGLLTRFLGILGIISGVLTVIPQLMPLPVVQSFWLITVGLLMLGAAPGGTPPAWSTGNAEPWPSQRRQAPARRAPAEEPATNGDGDGEPFPRPRAHPSSKKRKRKRRG